MANNGMKMTHLRKNHWFIKTNDGYYKIIYTNATNEISHKF